MEKDWLRNVPINIKGELKELDLSVGCLMGGEEKPVGVRTSYVIQKENKEKTKKMKELGWKQERGSIVEGTKHISFSKDF
jgi:hypothetical protein